MTLTWFSPDARKSGGRYLTVTGVVRRIDVCRQVLVMEDDREIPMEALAGVEGTLFREESA